MYRVVNVRILEKLVLLQFIKPNIFMDLKQIKSI